MKISLTTLSPQMPLFLRPPLEKSTMLLNPLYFISAFDFEVIVTHVFNFIVLFFFAYLLYYC